MCLCKENASVSVPVMISVINIGMGAFPKKHHYLFRIGKTPMQLQLSSGNALVRNMPQSVWKRYICIEIYLEKRYVQKYISQKNIVWLEKKIQKYMSLKNISCHEDFLASGFYFTSFTFGDSLSLRNRYCFRPSLINSLDVIVRECIITNTSYFNFYQVYFERAATAWLTSTLQTCAQNALKYEFHPDLVN